MVKRWLTRGSLVNYSLTTFLQRGGDHGESDTIPRGGAGVGDILVKICGKHYLIPAEAIGSPLEDGGTEILGMLEKELSTLEVSRDSADDRRRFRMELGAGGDRNARAITDDRNARAITENRR